MAYTIETFLAAKQKLLQLQPWCTPLGLCFCDESNQAIQSNCAHNDGSYTLHKTIRGETLMAQKIHFNLEKWKYLSGCQLHALHVWCLPGPHTRRNLEQTHSSETYKPTMQSRGGWTAASTISTVLFGKVKIINMSHIMPISRRIWIIWGRLTHPLVGSEERGGWI